jgi:hypothetical protein
MKKIVLFIFLFNLNNLNSQYCIPTPNGNHDEDFTMALLNTYGGITNINSNGYKPFTNFNNYSYNDSLICSQKINKTIQFTLMSNSEEGIRIWIDWNIDGDFNDLNESVISFEPGIYYKSGQIKVPKNASIGTTRMRIISSHFLVPNESESCASNIQSFEVLDYKFSILCPDLEQPQINDAIFCLNSSVTLNSNSDIGSISWFNQPNGGLILLNNSIFTTSSLTSDTIFYAQIDFPNCPSSQRDTVYVKLSSINIKLTPNLIECKGDSLGSISIDSIYCGYPPFLFSFNGNNFTSSLNNLKAGLYSVIIKDAVLNTSPPFEIFISEKPSAFIVESDSIVSVCAFETDLDSLKAFIQPLEIKNISYSIFNNINLQGISSIVNISYPIVPVNSIVKKTYLEFYGVTTYGWEWPTDLKITVTGATSLSQSPLAYIHNTVQNQKFLLDLSLINNSGDSVKVKFQNTYIDSIHIDSVKLFISYVDTNSSKISWYSELTNGTLLSNLNTFLPIGSSVLPNTNVSGFYNFYAEGEYQNCVNPIRGKVIVFVKPKPDVNINLNNNAEIIASPSNLMSYNWYQYYDSLNNWSLFCFENHYIPNANCSFFVITTNSYNCKDTSNLLTISTLSMNDVKLSKLSLYPNPTNGLVYVSNEGSSVVYNYTITDAQGRVIANANNAIKGASKTEINLQGKETGIYMIRVFNENSEKVFRVVLQ